MKGNVTADKSVHNFFSPGRRTVLILLWFEGKRYSRLVWTQLLSPSRSKKCIVTAVV